MNALLRRLLGSFRAFFVLPWSHREIIANVRQAKRAKIEVDHSAAHYFLGDLIENLDQCFSDMALLRRADPDAGDVFENIGVTVASSKHLIARDLEPSFFKTEMLAVGASHFPENKWREEDDDDTVYCSFAYFLKIKRPINVQASNSDIYKIGLVYKLESNKPIAGTFHISVSKSGDVRALRECAPRYQKPGFYRMEWSIPETLKGIVSWRNRKNNLSLSYDDAARELFSQIVNSAVAKEMGVMVRVRKCARVATFAIDMLRTPYFFADRDKTVNENGRTKRILHIVRTHQRADGRLIKSHWRGLRRFTWNGYDVSIGLPGRHHVSLMDFSAATVESVDAEGIETIELAEVSKLIDAAMTARAA